MALQNVFNILVDLKKVMSVNKPLVTQNDSVVFILEVMEDGVAFDLTGTTTVSLAHTRRDGTVVVTQGTKAGNKATFALGTNETAVPGGVLAKAQFYDANGRISTLSFSYQVGMDPTGEGYIPSEVEQTLIQVVMADAQAKIDELSQVDVVDLSLQLTEKAKQTDLNTTNAELALKATKTELSNVLSGTPKGTYTTLAALQAAYPTGTTGVYIVTADGHIYSWSGTAWADRGLYQAVGIAINSITTDKLADLKQGKNLFNKNMAVAGFYLNSNNGAVTASGTLSYSENYMLVNAATEYVISFENPLVSASTTTIVEYGADKAFIKSTKILTADAKNFTTAANTVFIRISLPTVFVNTFQIEVGAVATAYEDYYLYNKNLVVPAKPLAINAVATENIKPASITTDKLGDMEKSKNLFNKKRVVTGSYLNSNTGAVTASANYFHSEEYMTVKKSATYVSNPVASTNITVIEYDANKVYIKGTSLTVASPTLTTTANTAYVRISSLLTILGNVQLEEGVTATAYTDYYFYNKNIVSPATVGTTDIKDLILVDIASATSINLLLPSNPQRNVERMRWKMQKEVVPYSTGADYENKNLWRLYGVDFGNVDHETKVFTLVEEVVQSGAFETAIIIEGQLDALGTYHGYELLKTAYFYVDGVKVDVNTPIKKWATEFKIVYSSDLFRHGTASDLVCNVLREYVFNKDGLHLTQKLTWLAAFGNVTTGYITMLPIKRFSDDALRQITDTVVTDLDNKEYDVSMDNHATIISKPNKVLGVRKAHIYGITSKYNATVGVEVENNAIPLYFHVHNAPQYNKLYFSYGDGNPITVGQVWKNKTSYRIWKA